MKVSVPFLCLTHLTRQNGCVCYAATIAQTLPKKPSGLAAAWKADEHIHALSFKVGHCFVAPLLTFILSAFVS